MKKKNVLSLHEETEKEAAKIEKEILKDSKLEEIKVSDEMEKRLAEQIQAYEKTQSQKKKSASAQSAFQKKSNGGCRSADDRGCCNKRDCGGE